MLIDFLEEEKKNSFLFASSHKCVCAASDYRSQRRGCRTLGEDPTDQPLFTIQGMPNVMEKVEDMGETMDLLVKLFIGALRALSCATVAG